MILTQKYYAYALQKGWIKEIDGKIYLMKGLGAPYLIQIHDGLQTNSKGRSTGNE